MTTDCDLLVIGGGPAGLCAAINGSSEGLKVCLLDAGTSLGGQAQQSNSIENYPLPEGVHEGVTGARLMAGFVRQADKFETAIYAPVKAARLAVDGDRKVVTSEDYVDYAARAVILSLGLHYKLHPAKGLGQLMGKGVYYGLPSGGGNLRGRRTVGVIGGANSAGQAVLRLASNPLTKVVMLIRSKLEAGMSAYLSKRIRACTNVRVMEGVEVAEAQGDGQLDGVVLSNGISVGLDTLCIFIGAMPKTLWLDSCKMQVDERRFIRTDVDVNLYGLPAQRPVLPYETSLPGVFAAGDVRSRSTKRITAAIGEGVGALQSCHRYLTAQ